MAAMVVLLLTVVPIGAALAGDGEPPADVREPAAGADLNTQGLELYRAGKYREAVEVFLSAYAADKDPNLLFNIARCYELLGESAAALQQYERFLSSPDIEPDGRARATRAVQVLRERLESSRDTPPGAAKETPAEPTSAPAQHDEQSTRTRNKVVIGWTTTGALVAGAAVTGILALTNAGQLKDARAAFPANQDDINEKSRATTRCAIATDVLGAAAVVMGTLSLYWTIAGSRGRVVNAAIGAGQLKLGGSF
jgi:tetratricopeptide (TPR) repeat protein